MENKNNNYTGIVLCIILALGLGAFLLYSSKSKLADNALPPITEQKPVDNTVVATTTQSGKIDEHLTINNELRDVNFCGKTYKVKQVMIDGVDVVQRVAEILTKNLIPETLKTGPYGPKMDEWKTLTPKKGELEKQTCENISSKVRDGIVTIRDLGKTKEKRERIYEEWYHILVSETPFTILVTSSDIYLPDEYAGGIIGPIGKLK